MTITVYFDGLCDRNGTGVATYGFVVYRDGDELHADHGVVAEPGSPLATNNVAEYTGCLKALEWLVGQGLTREAVVVRGDSQLIIRQLNGEYKVRDRQLAKYFLRIKELFFRFRSLRFEWVPREQNREADALTNRALREWKRRDMGSEGPRGGR